MKKTRLRLDLLLVERGLFETRAKAQAAVMAGSVTVNGEDAAKAGSLTDPQAVLAVKPSACPYVSRGGQKLAAALKTFPLMVNNRVCLDVGASTGGFTDCLLQHGASRVYAIDVGTAQLHAKLRADHRVVSREKTSARHLRPEDFDPRPDLAVIDVSFISLTAVLPWVLPCLASPYCIVALIKPQFELTPKQAPKGVVRKPEYHEEAVEKVRRAAASLPLRELGLLQSPLKGPKGNLEFLICWQSSERPLPFR